MRLLAGFAVVLAWTAVASGQIVDVSWVGGAGTEFWSDDANWSPAGGADFLNARVHVGNRVPAAVTVVDNQYTLWALNITNGAEIHTDIWNLQVWNETTLSDAGSAMFVSDYFAGGSADSLVTDTLTVNDGAAVYIESDVPADWNFVHIWVTDLLDVNAGGTLQGFGRVVLDSRPLAEPTTMLDNNGLIRAYKAPEPGHSVPEPGSLIITSTDPDARVDLDGPGAVFGRLQVNANQVLDIQVPLADAFGGTIDLHTGARFRVEHPWELNGDAVVNVNTREIGTSSTPGDAATITGAAWTMTGGTINVDDRWDSLQFGSRCTATGGTINNSGALIFNAQVAIQEGVDFNMNGSAASLVVKPDKTVTINTPDFDLDGGAIPGFDNSAATTIEAGGVLNLNLGAGADMQFNHTINLNGGELNVANSEQSHWTLAFGAINAAGGATSRIGDAGVAVRIFSGRVHVTEDSTLFIHAPSEFDALANVVVDAGSTLDVGQATYSGGAYSGGGTFGKGSATIAAPTTWNVACVDLDDGPTTINADLTINADRLEEGTDGVDATHSINNDARLTVNVTDGQWTLDDGGAILYNGDSALHAYLAGSDVLINGFLGNVGNGSIDARITVGPTGMVMIGSEAYDATRKLHLHGGDNATRPNRMAGGVIGSYIVPFGRGILAADDNRALIGFGTINTDVDFDEASDLLADDGTLTISGAILDARNVGTADADGVFAVADAWNTSAVSNVLLQGGEVTGGEMTIGNPNGVSGYGLLSAPVSVDTRIRATEAGRTLVVESPANTNDWDGAANTGVLAAVAGTLELRGNIPFFFQGTVDVRQAGTVFANGFELKYMSDSTLSLHGGTYRSTNPTGFHGAMIVADGSSRLEIDGTATMYSGSSSAITGTLQLDNALTQINVGAAFSGGGTLLNLPASTLQLQDGADVDVLVQNQGSLELGASSAISQASALDYQQDASGVFHVDLAGRSLSQFDRLSLSGAAQVAGGLDIDLVDGFVPSLGDAFTILSAPGGVTGSLTSVVQPVERPAGTLFDVVYLPTLLQLVLVNGPIYSADFDGDGEVTAADIRVWKDSFGIDDGGDADHDGDTDGDDFLIWQRQLGSVPGLPVINGVPEPQSAALMALTAIIAMAAKRRLGHAARGRVSYAATPTRDRSQGVTL